MNAEVIVCSSDGDLAGRLIGFLRRQTEHNFNISYYGNAKDLMNSNSFCDHMFIDGDIYEKLRLDCTNIGAYGKLHIISSEKKTSYPRGYIYKFSPASKYLFELTGEYEGTENNDISNAALFRDRKARIKEEVLNSLLKRRDDSEEGVMRVIEEALIYENRYHPMDSNEIEQLRRELYQSIRGYDAIQDLLEDKEITEIMVNGYEHIFIEKGGRLYESSKAFESEEKLKDIINKIVSSANRSVNLASPIVDARLPDGSRVNVVLNPVAINGPIMTIRRFGDEPISDEMLINWGSVTRECMDFLNLCVKAGYNILISGGTGAGKTTFLNVLSGYIPTDERIITIEDSAELKIKGINNLIRFEARMETTDGVKAISIRDLIKTALRSRPDRVIVGEVRSEEAIDMLQALNIGQDGSMSTIHANSAVDALYRLETIVMLSSEIPVKALRRQIASGIDLVIHLGRLRDKSRKVLQITEILGMNGDEIETAELYSFEETGEDMGKVIGALKKKNELFHKDKLIRAGINYEL